jgi:hypothetical protein
LVSALFSNLVHELSSMDIFLVFFPIEVADIWFGNTVIEKRDVVSEQILGKKTTNG